MKVSPHVSGFMRSLDSSKDIIFAALDDEKCDPRLLGRLRSMKVIRNKFLKNDIVATDNHLPTTSEMFTSPKEKDLKQVSVRCEMCCFWQKPHSELPSGIN